MIHPDGLLLPARIGFASRGCWDTFVCWVVVLLMLLMIWVPTTARKYRQDECPGSLSFIVLRTATVEREERIAASRMIYYLVVAALLFVAEQF